MQTQTCFLLSYIKYGDNSAVLNCFSRDQGFQTFFAPNIYSARNKKKSYLFPLHEIQITLAFKKNPSALQSVTKIEKISNSYEYENVKVNSILFFISDFLYQVLRQENLYEKIYKEIQQFLVQLYLLNMDSSVAFLFKILVEQGISPLFSDEPFLNPETGNFSMEQSAVLFDAETSATWKNYLKNENSYSIKLKRSLRQKMIESLMFYYRIHFHEFREPPSLAVIQQIYD